MTQPRLQKSTSLAVIEAIRRLNLRAAHQLDTLAREVELTATDCLLLWELCNLRGAYGHNRPTDLAAATLMSSATVASRLNLLESTGLVRRNRDPDDRRVRIVVPTEAGVKCAHTTFAHWADQHLESLRLEPELLDALRATIEAIASTNHA